MFHEKEISFNNEFSFIACKLVNTMSRRPRSKKVFFILFIALVCCINAGCIDQENHEGEPSQDTLRIGVASPSFGFYPWIESYDTSTLSMNHNIFNALVGFDELFRIKAELAESWNNPDNVTWRFRLRKNVEFHNGYTLTAEDVKFSIDLIKNDETNVLRDLLVGVKEARVIETYTVDIITDKPCPILLNKLTDILIVSKKYQEETTNEWPIGTGAYRLVETSGNNLTTLERFDKYWKNSPVVKTVTFKVIENDEDRKNALLTHEINIAENILPLFFENLSKTPGISTYIVTNPTVLYVSFDFRDHDTASFKATVNPLSNVKVRKALYHAINISELIERVYHTTLFCEPASQYLTPEIFGYNPNISRLSYDLDKARELLNESGYGAGFNLTIDTILESYDYLAICDVLEEQLSKIINVSLNRLPVEEFFTKILMRNTSCYISAWIPSTGDGGEIYDYLIRTINVSKGIGTYNTGYYSNPEVDRIGAAISCMMDPMKRLTLMKQGFEIAMDDVACIPLLSWKSIHAADENIDWVPSLNMNIKVENIGFRQD